ncbi:MAG: hypothetical protein KDB74_00430 [Flavobacteriales bacterium]|nr:hypothetical protein [Flavobacteriales bacterium]
MDKQSESVEEIEMNYREQLLKEHSKANSLILVDYIGNSQERFDEFMHCFFTNEYRVNQRSAMVLSACFDRRPHLIHKHLDRLINQLNEPQLHVALKRNTIRILQFLPIPESLESGLFDNCLKFILDPKEAIAVKAFSMKVCVNICKRYPELKHELIPIIEDQMERSDKMGIQARGKAMLKELAKI